MFPITASPTHSHSQALQVGRALLPVGFQGSLDQQFTDLRKTPAFLVGDFFQLSLGLAADAKANERIFVLHRKTLVTSNVVLQR
jgi:hypothetical protein